MTKTIAALIAAVMLSAAAGAQERAKYVTPDFGNTYTFAAVGGNTLGVFVPVTLEKDVVFGSLTASVANVTGPASSSGLITAAMQLPQGATPRIAITADAMTLAPGVYTITVEIAQTPARAAAPPTAPPLPQRLALQLTMPAAEIKTPAAQTIDLVRYCLRCTNMPPVLHVLESGHAELTAAVRQIEELKATDGTYVAAKIRSAQPVRIGRSDAAEIPLVIDHESELPLGKSSTTVAITSSQLAAAVPVPYEIRVRLASWLLIPAIVAGLAFGFLLRVGLKRLIERDTATVSAYDVLQRLKTAAGRESDAVFLAKLAAAQAAVVDSLTGDAAAITAAVTSATTALTDANADLTKRLEDLRSGIAQMSAMTGSADAFPDPIAGNLRDAAQQLDDIRTQWEQRDAAAGSTALMSMQDSLAKELDASAADWAAEMQIAVAVIKQLPPLPPLYAQLLGTNADQLSAKVNAIVPGSGIKTVLDAINGAQSFARHWIEIPILTPLAQYGLQVAQELGENGKGVEKAAQALDDVVADDTPHTLKGPAEALDTLMKKMRDTINSVASSQPALVQPVGELLTAGKYVEAAASLGAGEVIASKEIGEGAVPAMASVSAAMKSWMQSIAPPPPPMASAADDWAERGKWSRLSLAVAKAANSLTIAVLLAVVGFAFLLPSFDGTLRGLLTAFFWGYASDFSADAITNAAKQVK